MTFKVINKPTGVSTKEADTLANLGADLDTAFMVVATEHVESDSEPYQAINYEKLGKVQINYRTGPVFKEASTIAEALNVNVTPVEEYELLQEQPSDWVTKYASYFTKEGSSYNPVEGVEDISYTPAFEADTYYQLGSDDATYELVSEEPSDWGTGDYWEDDQGTTKVEFELVTSTVAPDFVSLGGVYRKN